MTLVEMLSDMTTRTRGLAATAALRVGLAVAILHLYSSSFRDRQFLWGPHGMFGSASGSDQLVGHGWFPWLDVYRFADTPHEFDLIYFSGIAAAFLLLFIGGRGVTILNLVLFMSLSGRNIFVNTGGENVCSVLLPFLALTRNNCFFALRARARREGECGAITVLVHNWATAMILIEATLVYAVAGLWKLAGPPWQEGLAVYNISQIHAFQFVQIPTWIVANPFLTTMLSYSVIVLEVGLAAAIIGRRERLILVGAVAAIFMHLTIAIFMGLVGFAITMIAVDAFFIAGIVHRRLAARVVDASTGSSGPAVADPTAVAPVSIGS